MNKYHILFLFEMFLYKILEYYSWKSCDKTFETESKNKDFRKLTHVEIERKYTNKTHYRKTRFFDMDETLNNYTTNHKKSSFSVRLKVILN